MKRCRGRRRRSLLPPLPLRDRHGFSITQNSHHNKQTGNIHKTRKHTQDGTNQTTTPTNRTQTPPNKPHPQNPTQRNPHNTHTTQPNPHHNTTKQPTPNNPHQTKKQKRGQGGRRKGEEKEGRKRREKRRRRRRRKNKNGDKGESNPRPPPPAPFEKRARAPESRPLPLEVAGTARSGSARRRQPGAASCRSASTSIPSDFFAMGQGGSRADVVERPEMGEAIQTLGAEVSEDCRFHYRQGWTPQPSTTP